MPSLTNERWLRLTNAGLILLAILPFAAVYLAHFLCQNGIATGFIQVDMPYYSANGREIFERGNGFAYPNPYDPSDNAPVIYFHWLVWLLGFGITKLGFDPGVQFVVLGGVAGVSMTWMTWKLVCLCLPTAEYRRTLFLAGMWGGGLLCLGRFLINGLEGKSLFSDPLGFDPGSGMWFLNWGRNLIYPTEAVYHTLMIACWWCILTKKEWLGVLIGMLLAATHPWSGLEVLGTLGAFLGLRWLVLRDMKSFFRVGTVAFALAAFLCYNLFYLDSFEQHRALHTTWQLDWSLSGQAIVFAWFPIGALAFFGLLDKQRDGWNRLFLALAFCVAFSLSIHDRFISPTQPLHFTRGYVWMPLFLLGLPVAQRCLMRLRESMRTPTWRLAVCGIALVVVSDNLVFLATQVDAQQTAKYGYHMTEDSSQLVSWLNANQSDAVTVCHDEDFSYLLATYTSTRPYTGHFVNSPRYDDRFAQVEMLYQSGGENSAVQWFEQPDLAVVHQTELNTFLACGWVRVFSSGKLAIVRVGPNSN